MLNFPSNCNTPEERTGFCYRAQELLRFIHNAMSWWHRGFDYKRDGDGNLIRDSEGEPIINPDAPWTQKQWNRLPQRIKNRYPYKPQLSMEEWDDFYRLFEVIQDRVVQPLLKNRELLKQSNKWAVDPEDLTSED